MREELKSLDELEMNDLWERARIRVPGSDGFDPRSRHQKRGPAFAVVVAALVLLGLVVWELRPLVQDTTTPLATPEPVLPLRAKVAATIPISSPSGGIAAGAGSVWVAAPFTRFPMDNDSVARIDPATNDVVDRIAVPQFFGDVSDVAADATGAWVTSARRYNDQTLALTIFPIDLANDHLGAPIEGVGGQLAVSGGTLWAFATGTATTPTEIVRIDKADGTILSRTPLGGTGTDIVLGDGSVYVPILAGDASVHDIVEIDAATGDLARTISLGVKGTYEVPVYAGGALWIPVCCTDNEVLLYQVDPSSGQKIGDPLSVGDGLPFGSAAGNILSMSERGRLDALDPGTGTLATLAQSEWPASHTSTVYDPSTQAVWVANYKDMVTRIDIKPIEAQSTSSPSPAHSHADWATYRLPAEGLTIQAPVDWHLIEQPLPAMAEPHALIEVASSGISLDPDSGCAPTNALARLANGQVADNQVVFWLVETGGKPLPARTDPFPLQNLSGYDCITRSAYLTPFSDQGRNFELFAVFGPRASDALHQDVIDSLTSLKVDPDGGTGPAQGAAASWFEPPTFGPAAGWQTLSSSEDGSSLSTEGSPITWASNVPFQQADLATLTNGKLTGEFWPEQTIHSLVGDQVVLVVSFDEPGVTAPISGGYPTMELPLDIHDTSGPVEGGNQSVLWAGVNGQHLTVRFFYGTDLPTDAQFAAAQAELNNLRVPSLPPAR